MMTVATTIVCGEAYESRLDQLLPVLVAGAGVLAFFTVDRTRSSACTAAFANLLAPRHAGRSHRQWLSMTPSSSAFSGTG